MSVRDQFTVRAVIVYLLAVALAWVLTPLVWGGTGGLAIGLSINLSPEVKQRTAAFLEERGITADTSRADAMNAYQNLSEEDRAQLRQIVGEAMKNIDWFAMALVASAIVFGLVGFLAGFFARSWLLAGGVPALTLLTYNLVTGFRLAKALPTWQKVVVVVVAQFAVCYLMAYFGAWLGLRMKQRRALASKRTDATPQ
jgi:hypothetical protein